MSIPGSVFRFHPPLRRAVCQIIVQVFLEGHTIEHAFRNVTRATPALGSRDRRQIGAAAYQLIRYWRLFNHLAGEAEQDFAETAILKRLAFWESHPDSLPPLVPPASFLIAESWPDWYQEAFDGVLEPDQWQRLLRALNAAAPLDLRVNTIRFSVDDIFHRLDQTGLYPVMIPGTDGIRLPEHTRIDSIPGFPESAVEVQDAGSQMAGLFTRVQPGMRVLDACAGGGGKSLQMACIMQDKGVIMARDANPGRLKGLAQRLGRLKYRSIRLDSAPSPSDLASFDTVLLDVPCSGTGTVRRQPERKYLVTQDEVQRMVHLQRSILLQNAGHVSPGGTMVYVTCSILPDENERQSDWILHTFPEFVLDEQQRLGPDTNGTDGFFMARFIRK